VLPDEVEWGAVGAAILATIAGVFTWITQRSKGRVDESIAAISEWQKLTSTLSSENESLRAELKAEQKSHVDEITAMRTRHEAELKALRQMNEGLLRIITQNSQTKAQLLGGLDNGSNGK
jgi:septal ring factor EnvC (AmiA/AmiB activator)